MRSAEERKVEDELFEIVTDAGAEDLRDDEDNFEIITSPTDFDTVLGAVKEAGVEPQVAEVEMVAKEYKKLEGADARQMLKLMEALEDHDDVQKVSANFDISDADMAAPVGDGSEQWAKAGRKVQSSKTKDQSPKTKVRKKHESFEGKLC